MPRVLRSSLRLAALLLLSVTLTGCRSVPSRLGATGPEAIATSDGLFGGIAARFSSVTRDPKAQQSRERISRQALLPASLFADTAAWTSAPDANTRAIRWRGSFDGGRTTFRIAADRRRPARPGEGLHELYLRRLPDGAYEWRADVDLGVGQASPANLAALPAAFIAAGETDDLAAMRLAMPRAFPASTRAWGQVFTLRQLRSERDASGAWRQRHTIVLTPAKAAQTYPLFGKWLRDYMTPIRMQVRLRDSARTWLDLTIDRDTLVLAFRSRGGVLLPLEGGDTPMPDIVGWEQDFQIRLRFLRVGFTRLRGVLYTVREPARRGWVLRFRDEPEWDLPPLTESMLRAPLRRPFTGDGSTLSIVATARPGEAQTVLARTLRVPVQESAILRFLSRLASGAVEGYVSGAEPEATAWLVAAFGGLQRDFKAVLTGD
jgi:hypothetical protein